MSKRPVSDIDPDDSRESNKKPNIHTSQQPDESHTQSINQPECTTTNPSESQTSAQAAGPSIQEGQNETISPAATQTGDTSVHKGDAKSSDDNDVDSEDEADRSKVDHDMEYEFGIPEFIDFTFHFVDESSCRCTYHFHRIVLASMSKLFETLLRDALKDCQESTKPSTCKAKSKCQQPGHHFVSFRDKI